MSDTIRQTLSRLFAQHRIIFWYDAQRELQAEYEAVQLPHVTKLIIDNNEFGLKHRLLRQEPGQKFLLYHYGPQPDDLNNWLLDVQLAHTTFRADQTGLWLHELGLGIEFSDIVAAHTDFFKAAPRRAALKAILKEDDSHNQIKLKMTAVCAGAEARLDDILEHLLAEFAHEADEKMRLLQRCQLDTVLWQRAQQAYGYQSEAVGIHDFALTLFKSAYALSLDEPASLTHDALVLLRRWKDNVHYREAFTALSAKMAATLKIEADLAKRTYSQLLTLDLFELIDRKILSDMVYDVVNRTISSDRCSQVVRQRQLTVWYETYARLYQAIDSGCQILHQLDQLDLMPRSFEQGIRQYCQIWFRIDSLYRQFINHNQLAKHQSLLKALLDEVNNRYTNQYLLPLNDQWQAIIDGVSDWQAIAAPRQQDFYENYVAPFLRRGKKLFVIISDGLRYEIGAELTNRIRQEDRFEATLATAVTMLPSFTQLGMAALLPHQQLTFAEDHKTILVDGQRSVGTDNRRKILGQATEGQATALQAQAFLEMSGEARRQLFRDHTLVYLYHNRIDATGDKRDSEARVFKAAAETIDELILIIKRLASANVTNMVVTADHGFIYQHAELAESDFASEAAQGSHILTTNRRFVLGHGLIEGGTFKKFTAVDVGLGGQIEMLLPKSINRLRVKGAGSHYVHGGASLQEIVVPVIQINKKRQSDVTKVPVDILRGAGGVITTNQTTIRFYQTDPVTAKVQPRNLRVGFYTETGRLISDQHELLFDFSSDKAREREQPVQFILTREADEANGQEIVLRLEEPIEGTSHYQLYQSVRYTLKRAFTSDFDF